MAISEQLEDWIGQRDRQRLTRQAADRFALEWNSGPFHQRFSHAIARLPEQSAEAAAAAVRALFADDRWVDALIDGLADRLGSDPFFEPPMRAIDNDIHTALIVYEDECLSIGAGVANIGPLAAKKSAKRGRTSIGFTGQMSVIKFVRAGGARLSFWEAPAITADFTAAEAGRCRRTGERLLADGDVLTIDGRYQAYVVEHAQANFILLQAAINLDQAPLSVEYDSASHDFVGCSACGDSGSRIQMLTTLLRKLDSGGAFAAVADFLDHKDFFVRWHAMRELLGIDVAAALPHLKRMAARDPHGDVRRAARAVLDRLEAPASRQAAA